MSDFITAKNYSTYDCVCAGRRVTLHTRYFLFIAPQWVISTFKPTTSHTSVTFKPTTSHTSDLQNYNQPHHSDLQTYNQPHHSDLHTYNQPHHSDLHTYNQPHHSDLQTYNQPSANIHMITWNTGPARFYSPTISDFYQPLSFASWKVHLKCFYHSGKISFIRLYKKQTKLELLL